jgi:hypothetical protein
MARQDADLAPPQTRPAGICAGPGHVVIYGNPAFHAQFGSRCIGMPAREVMVDLPETAFALLDAVLEGGRPLARWVQRGGEQWRLTATPRRDPDTETIDGVAFHLRARDDLPVVEGGAAR